MLRLVRCCMACNWQRIRLLWFHLCLIQLGGLVLLLYYAGTNGRLDCRATVQHVLVCKLLCRALFVVLSFCFLVGGGNVFMYVKRNHLTNRDECSTHQIAQLGSLCTHQLIMFTARLDALPNSFRVACFRTRRSTHVPVCYQPPCDRLRSCY